MKGMYLVESMHSFLGFWLGIYLSNSTSNRIEFYGISTELKSTSRPIESHSDATQEKLALRKEKGIPALIPLNLRLVILLRIEILPHAGGKNMFVPLVPATINYFGVCWIVICAFNNHRGFFLGGFRFRGV